MAQKAVDERKIDSLFFDRYKRLLRVVWMIMIDDTEGLLTPLIISEALQFDTNEKEKLNLKQDWTMTIHTINMGTESV